MEEELIQFIQQDVVEQEAEVCADTRLFEEKILSSMNILDLIGFIESRSGKKLSDEDLVMQNFATPRRIIEVFFK